MSLPIILFSSTGRRGISEKLKAYGNIITDFEKPRLPALDPTFVLDESRTKFIRALEVAIPMVAARRLVPFRRWATPGRISRRLITSPA